MAESFSGTHSGFNMAMGLSFAATNERRDLSTLSQMRLLIMEQQQNDVTVEASTGREKNQGFSGDCVSAEPVPWLCKAGGLTAGNGAHASTQVTSSESNAVVSPGMQEQGIASMPPSIPRTNLGGNETTKEAMFAYVKPITVPSTKGLETVVVEEDE